MPIYDRMTDFEKGIYLGMAYSLFHNSNPTEPQYLTGVAYNADEEDPFKVGDWIIPAPGPDGWMTWQKFDHQKFDEAFHYLYSDDEPNVTKRYQLYVSSEKYDRQLMIWIRTSEDDEDIPEDFGVGLEILPLPASYKAKPKSLDTQLQVRSTILED